MWLVVVSAWLSVSTPTPSLVPILPKYASDLNLSAAVQLALNDMAPSHSTLSTLNALALTVVAALRSLAPALFTSIFATGVKTQILGGYLVWAVMIAIALGLKLALEWLPAKAEGKLDSTTETE
jgi:hypothetical protein